MARAEVSFKDLVHTQVKRKVNAVTARIPFAKDWIYTKHKQIYLQKNSISQKN